MSKTGEIKIGATVWLKIGSHAMSVKMAIEDTGEVLCTWHDKSSKPQQQWYSVEQLTTYKTDINPN